MSRPPDRCRDSDPALSLQPELLVQRELSAEKHPAIGGHPKLYLALIDGFHMSVQTNITAGRPAAKSHLRDSQPTAAHDDVHSLSVRLVGDDEAACGMPSVRYDCHVELNDLMSQNDRVPFVELEKMDPAVFKQYMDKYKGEQLAKKMAKAGERTSDRKRKAQSQTLAASAVKPVPCSSNRKRFRSSASPAVGALVLVAPVRSKRRTFCAYPAGEVVPNIFRRLMHADALNALCDWTAQSDPPFESPIPSISFLDSLTFEDLVELSDCSQLLDDAGHTIRGEDFTNVRVLRLQSNRPDRLTDSPPPAAHCPLIPAVIASIESCEPAPSPPRSSPAPSPLSPDTDRLAPVSPEPPEQPAAPETVTPAHKPASNESNSSKAAEEKVSDKKQHNDPAVRSEKSKRVAQRAPGDADSNNASRHSNKKDKSDMTKAVCSASQESASSRPPAADQSQPQSSFQDKKKKAEKQTSAGVSLMNCSHCFMSQLPFSRRDLLLKHMIHAHPELPIMPPLSPPSSSRQ